MQAASGPTILVAEDESEVRSYLEIALRCYGYSVHSVEDGDEALRAISAGEPQVAAVLLDLIMPRRCGLDVLREVKQQQPDLPVIVLSGASSTLNVVEAMRLGASDFLPKPVDHEELERALKSALEPQRPAPGIAQDNGSVCPGPALFRSISPRMAELRGLVERVACSEAPVLILGETGSGKEVLARELHEGSPRAAMPFLKLNCAALPSELVESELFGYERGAFTGAVQRKSGMFELADRGTIMLDEIGDMPHRLQAKLLQVLQDREFHRLGGKETIHVDVRVVAVTHRDLEIAMQQGTFREDLYYRLNVISIHLPPLRERREDIIPLCEYFLDKYAIPSRPVPRLTPGLREAMLDYTWPGNVRELENLSRRMVVVGDIERIAADLRSKMLCRIPLLHMSRPASPGAQPAESVLQHVSRANRHAEADAILAALNTTHWNRKRAARLLNIDYKALLYKMKKLSIESRPLAVERA